mgnify:CR=1 FL=1
MKNLLLAVLGTTLITFSAAHAAGDHHPDEKKPPAESRARPQADQPAQAGPMAIMQNMRSMQAQMEKLRATKNPKERESLLREHMKTMQDAMASMHAMGGEMMGGAAARSGATTGRVPMEQRLDMMQMMMEQMMGHQNAMQGMR